MPNLPARTSPPDVVVRAHAPATGRYESYRPCLRWDFGFACAFCLTHEADLAEHGVERTGLTSIEHRIPRSDAEAGAAATHVYANCYYACRFCNGARSARPLVDARGRRLLDPCADAWSTHFERVGAELRPRSGDADAVYTAESYDVDDPRKQLMRRNRERIMGAAERASAEIPPLVAELGARLAERPDPALLAVMRRLDEQLADARRARRRFARTPEDAPTACRCR